MIVSTSEMKRVRGKPPQSGPPEAVEGVSVREERIERTVEGRLNRASEERTWLVERILWTASGSPGGGPGEGERREGGGWWDLF